MKSNPFFIAVDDFDCEAGSFTKVDLVKKIQVSL